jgi:hypothetical protein
LTRQRWCEWTELAGSVSWFAMDYAWFEGATRSAVWLAVPTAVCALAVVGLTTPAHLGSGNGGQPSAAARQVAGSMAAWAVMNSLWMLHDLDVFHAPWLIRICFLLGAGLLAAASVRHGRLASLARELVANFGRLRAR